MNELLSTLLGHLKRADGGSKVVAALVGLAIVATAGIAAVVSNRPDYQITFSGLSGREASAVSKALADEDIPFRVSQPPGPFIVYVDEDDRSSALAAAYGAGALDKPLKGIMTEPGISSVFMGSAERMQMVQKRDWEEVESMLEELDPVVSATIRAATPDRTPFANDAPSKATASVTLTLLGNRHLTKELAMTVARLVSGALGVQEDNLIISDQAGNSPYDPRAERDKATNKSLLALKLDYDRRTADRVNGILADLLGPQKARVAISSEWDFEQSTTHTETSGKGGLLSETRNITETPVTGPGSGGEVSVVTNTSNDPSPAPIRATDEEPLIAKTSEERKEYQPTVTTTQAVRSREVLKRQSVALYLDASIDDTLKTELESTIKASVGFAEGRDDFSRADLAFYRPAEQESSPQPVSDGLASNPLLEMLLRRGVEIVTAVIFIGLLLKSLSSARRTQPGPAAAEEKDPDDEEIDPELLARMQVESLLKADPDKVGQVLASWARQEKPSVGARG